MQAKLTAIGTHVPEQVIDNHYYERMIDTSDEWIQSRTGIRERRFTKKNEYTSHIAEQAIHNLMDNYSKDVSDVDYIIFATVTPDHVMPSMAAIMQHRFQMGQAAAIDISAACAGFGYGINLAKALIESGLQRKVLVIGAETLSKATDFNDRTSCVLFGDGAGAALIESAEESNIGQGVNGAEGKYGPDLYMSTRSTLINGETINASGNIYQNGRKVFKWAVNRMSEQVEVLLKKNNLAVDDIDWFIPHSANMRIIEAICKSTGIPMEKALESISVYGNTSSASIPLAWQLGLEAGKIKKGDKLLILGFGGGLAFAGNIIEWAG
jgi:3-oxoacyl-[acyl-carrier-protein] synthase III